MCLDGWITVIEQHLEVEDQPYVSLHHKIYPDVTPVTSRHPRSAEGHVNFDHTVVVWLFPDLLVVVHYKNSTSPSSWKVNIHLII